MHSDIISMQHSYAMYYKEAHPYRGWWKREHYKPILETLQHVTIYVMLASYFHYDFQTFQCALPHHAT